MKSASIVLRCLAIAGLGVLVSTTGASVAMAANNIGTLAIQPSNDTVDAAPTLKTSGPCPTGSTASVAKIFGHGFPVFGQNMTGVAKGTTSDVHAFVIPSEYTLRDLAALTYPAVTYTGQYSVEVICRKLANPTDMGHFVGTISFTSPFAYSSKPGGIVPATPQPGHAPLPTPMTTKPAPTKSTAKPTTKPSASTSASASPNSTPSTAASSSVPVPSASGMTAAGSSSDGNTAILAAVIGAVVGAGLVGGLVWWRTRPTGRH